MQQETIDILKESVFEAYYDARQHKRNTLSQLRFEQDLEGNLLRLADEIACRVYHPGPCECFISEYPVKREVFASPFRDRVVHHLVYNAVASLFDRRFIYDSYSCRVRKGTLFGIERFAHHLRSCSHDYTKPVWILQFDLSGYFMSIDRSLLYDIIRVTLARAEREIIALSGDTIDYLVREILFRDPLKDCHIRGSIDDWQDLPRNKTLMFAPPGVGLPIGDLTSQLFSNIYLNELDQYVKRQLGCRHYGRYVDDGYVIHESREFLESLVEPVRRFLEERLRLKLHPRKLKIVRMHYGVKFLGAYIRPYRRYAADRSVSHFRQKMYTYSRVLSSPEPVPLPELRHIRDSINSYLGYMRHFRTFNILRKALARAEFVKYFRIEGNFLKVKLRRCWLEGKMPPGEDFLRDMLLSCQRE